MAARHTELQKARLRYIEYQRLCFAWGFTFPVCSDKMQEFYTKVENEYELIKSGRSALPRAIRDFVIYLKECAEVRENELYFFTEKRSVL